MKLDAIMRLAEACREKRNPTRCGECMHYGAADCAWMIEMTPDRKSVPIRREMTIDERVRRVFAMS